MTPKYDGCLVNFEGIDQSGKSTQVEKLKMNLAAAGVEPLFFREPGGTSISEQIRRILLSTDNENMDSRCELLLYTAARAQLVSEKIIPALTKGRFVILDRFYHSTIAYQCYGRGLAEEWAEVINREAVQGIEPDLTFIFDIAPDEAIHRRDEAGRDRIEQSALEFFEKVRSGYLKMAKGNERLVVLDGRCPREVLEKEVWRRVREKLLKK